MEKRISYSQFQSVKSVAKACDPLMVKRNKLKAKLDALQLEYDSLNSQVSALEAGILQIIGFHVDELVKKVIETSQDKNGKEVKVTKYVPTDMVTYDKDNKQYVISVPEEISEDNTCTGSAPSEEVTSEVSTEDSNI
jgi:hypothetical protein